MTKTDESPEEATEPYWSDELLAVPVEALGDEDQVLARKRTCISLLWKGWVRVFFQELLPPSI